MGGTLETFHSPGRIQFVELANDYCEGFGVRHFIACNRIELVEARVSRCGLRSRYRLRSSQFQR
jgi:hypothetical protein